MLPMTPHALLISQDDDEEAELARAIQLSMTVRATRITLCLSTGVFFFCYKSAVHLSHRRV